MMEKRLQVDLEPYNVNGVIHIGAGTGEHAGYYHKLGVNKVLWIEEHGYKYGPMYSNTCKYAMDQKIVIAQALDHDEPPHVKKFISIWRDNASFIDIDTYDLLHIASPKCREKILEGCGFLLQGLKVLVFSGGDGTDHARLETFLGPKGFKVSSFVTSDEVNEILFVRG